MNYGTLKAAILDYTHRSDVPTATIVEQAEGRIYAELRCREMETLATVSATSGIASLPTDFIEARDLWVVIGTGRGSVPFVGRDALGGYIGAGGSYPAAASIYGTTLEIAPAVTIDMSLLYYARPPAMTSDSDQPVPMATQPGLFLQAALVEAYGWLQDDEREAKHLSLYAAEMAQANAAAAQARAGARPQTWTRRTGFAATAPGGI